MDPTTRHALLFHFFEVSLYEQPDSEHRQDRPQHHPYDSAQVYHFGSHSGLRLGRAADPPSTTKLFGVYDGGGGISISFRICLSSDLASLSSRRRS